VRHRPCPPRGGAALSAGALIGIPGLQPNVRAYRLYEQGKANRIVRRDQRLFPGSRICDGGKYGQGNWEYKELVTGQLDFDTIR